MLLHTCALIWWVMDMNKLSLRAKKSLDKANLIAISSISIWEVGIKVKKKQLIWKKLLDH